MQITVVSAAGFSCWSSVEEGRLAGSPKKMLANCHTHKQICTHAYKCARAYTHTFVHTDAHRPKCTHVHARTVKFCRLKSKSSRRRSRSAAREEKKTCGLIEAGGGGAEGRWGGRTISGRHLHRSVTGRRGKKEREEEE